MKNNDPTSIWFVEGDESFRFGFDEYCLITGLKGNYEGDIDIPDDDSYLGQISFLLFYLSSGTCGIVPRHFTVGFIVMAHHMGST